MDSEEEITLSCFNKLLEASPKHSSSTLQIPITDILQFSVKKPQWKPIDLEYVFINKILKQKV